MHDIGKGRDGDHSIVGAEISADTAKRMTFDDEHVQDIEFLVREHLYLAATATRRDLNDAATIDEAMQRIGTPYRLAMLYLLTRADSLATGAEAWSSFRASLVRELYVKVSRVLEGRPVDAEADASRHLEELQTLLGLSRDETLRIIGPMPEAWMHGFDQEAAARQIALLAEPLRPSEVRTSLYVGEDADEFILVAPDRPGLFSTVAGVLALRGVDVHDAEIYTRSDGIAVEVFRVIGAHGEMSDEKWARLSREIEQALDGEIDVDDALARKAAQARRRVKRPAGVPTKIVVDNDASQTNTVVEVHTEDRLGLLRTITKVFAVNGCDLSLAKVATYGSEVVDVFYVRDLEGKKIADADHLLRIETGLRKAVAPSDPQPGP